MQGTVQSFTKTFSRKNTIVLNYMRTNSYATVQIFTKDWTIYEILSKRLDDFWTDSVPIPLITLNKKFFRFYFEQ